MFSSVLIANRGEIALRIQRACRLLGLRTIAAYSEAIVTPRMSGMPMRLSASGRRPPHEATSIRPPSCSLPRRREPRRSIRLRFLSEMPLFAEAVAAAGLTFIGPDASCIRTMGDKVAAKRRCAKRRPLRAGPDGALPDDERPSAGRRRHRLSRDPQGRWRRRWAGHASGGVRERPLHRAGPHAEEARRGSAIPRSTRRNFSVIRGMWKSRSSPTGMETRSGSAVATVRCSGDIRKCWRKRQLPTCRRRWWRRSARAAPRPAARSAT